MNDDNIFADANPFKKLSKKGFKEKASGTKAQEKKPKQAEKSPAETELDQESALFLRTMQDSPTKSFGKNGQRANLHNPLPINTEKKKKKKKKEFEQDILQKAQAAESKQVAEKKVKAEILSKKENEAEEALFFDAMQSVSALPLKGRDIPKAPEPPKNPPPPLLDEQALDEAMPADIEFSLASTREYVEGYVVGLDLALLGKLQAGQLRPEAHIDLHGLDSQKAFLALLDFFKVAYLKNQRIVLVVPGRGLNSPAGIAILREKVQEWFTRDPLKRIILAFCTAKPHDGGAGALYVLIRKLKKSKGKIIWQRMPIDSGNYALYDD